MNNKTVNRQLFVKNGGIQPETWDTEAIIHYFIGNFAKQWTMCDGYITTYLFASKKA